MIGKYAKQFGDMTVLVGKGDAFPPPGFSVKVVALYGDYIIVIGRDVARYVSTDWFAKRTLAITPLLTVAVLFTFTQCGVVGGKTQGEPPWLLIAYGITSNTPSVDDQPITTTTVPVTEPENNPVTPQSPSTGHSTGSNPTGNTVRPTTSGTTEVANIIVGNGHTTTTPNTVRPTTSGSGNTASSNNNTTTSSNSPAPSVVISPVVPVVGMYFLHPASFAEHQRAKRRPARFFPSEKKGGNLGSITMITDGRGNVISGGNNGGKSHISYKPYGEIHRTDSSGPDITRFKFTGQEEDKESGLMYYKARYYDPAIGRFIQADSVIMPVSTFGMNRYMYVGGNPVRYGDSGGNARHNGDKERQIQYFTAAVIGFQQDGLRGAALGLGSIKSAEHRSGERKLLGRNQKRPEKYDAEDALADIANGFQRIAHDINHFNGGAIQAGAKWASHGLQRAADTANIFTFGRHHNENSLSHKIGRSISGRLWQKFLDFENAPLYRNRHCVSLGVQTAALIYTGNSIYQAGAAAGTGTISLDAFSGSSTALGGTLEFFGASQETAGWANLIYNEQDVARTPIDIIQAVQNCHIKSL